MKKKITLNDVATQAGVSPATVSFVLSGKAKISSEVCRRVNNAVEDLGYVYKKNKNGSSAHKTVGIILDLNPDLLFVYSFVRPILHQIQLKLRSLNINALIIPIDNNSKESDIRTVIMDNNYFAVISMLYTNESLFEYLACHGINVVVLMNDTVQHKCHSVLLDDYQAMFDAAAYLIKKGHKNLIYVDYVRKDIPSLLVDRYNGFLKAMTYYRLKHKSNNHITLENTKIDEVTKKLKQIMHTEEDRPTSIVALDDYVLISIYYALVEMGYRIPDDISLISVGNVLDYNLPYIPQLTTIKINNRLAGDLAVDLLMNVIDQKLKHPQIVKVTCQINEGMSCKDLP